MSAKSKKKFRLTLKRVVTGATLAVAAVGAVLNRKAIMAKGERVVAKMAPVSQFIPGKIAQRRAEEDDK